MDSSNQVRAVGASPQAGRSRPGGGGAASDSDSPDTLNRRGGILLGQGDFEGAIALFDRALELEPQMAAALTSRGYSLLHLGRLDEAEAAATRALEVSAAPKIRASAKVLLGKVAEKRGDRGQARERYLEALREQRAYPQAKDALATLTSVSDQPQGEPQAPPTEQQGSPKPFVDPFADKPDTKTKDWVDPFSSE